MATETTETEQPTALMIRNGRRWHPLYLQSCIRCGAETFGRNCERECTNPIAVHRELRLPDEHPDVVAEKRRRLDAWQLEHFGRTW